jgi:hypothetical protein
MVEGPSRRGDAVSSKAAAVFAVLCLGAAVLTGAEDKKKLKKPVLELRSSPRFAFSPASVLFTAELKGGDDVEELYCPEVEWEWGDGGKSLKEADCDPWADGTAIDRRFTSTHVFQTAGMYLVKVTLRKSGRDLATQNVEITIRAGLGDPNSDPGS